MNLLQRKFEASPMLARVLPLLIFISLTVLQGEFDDASRYWLYLVKTLVGAWLIWVMRPAVAEMRWKFSWAAVVVGVAVFGIWIGLDDLYPKLVKSNSVWNPHATFGKDSILAWTFIVVRFVGASLVVPPLEEVFYRSFLYRYLARADFQSVPLGRFARMPFLIAALVFGLAHREWLAGIICACAYQGLVIWKKRLGDAMTAHAVTNFLLGLWVVWKAAWQFW